MMRAFAVAALVLMVGCSRTNSDADGGGSGDGGGANGSLTISPLDVDIGRVSAGSTGSAQLTVTATADVTLAAPTLAPATDGFAIDASSTCVDALMLSAGASCTLVISFAPTAPRAALQVTVSVPSSLGTAQATVSGRSPGAIIETLPGTPPSLNAVFTVDGNIAYAVGDSDSVWRRDGNGWAALTGPVGDDVAKMDGVWAAADDDVYVTSYYGGTTVFHSTDRGNSWTSLASMSTNPMSIAGTDADHVYVAGIEGDIAVGSAAGEWSIDRPADNTQWQQIANGEGTMLAVRSAGVWALDSSWTEVIQAGSAAVFWGTWGTSNGDFYAVGTNPQCKSVSSCGLIYHSVHGDTPTVKTAGATAFYGIYGSSSGTIYAVGDSGYIATSSYTDVWTWTMPVSVQLNAVHAANGHVYAVGAAGTIVHIIE
jgi:hypothetical protein